ncbi:DUF3093 domain-containing protein [Corynebacterium kroppenstedtii]|uniref:DUF3093 domain-containing protein n=1 Tax=Corynebacterium sp. PCR 32 TaxID=3351342 RepID=UPI0030A817F6
MNEQRETPAQETTHSGDVLYRERQWIPFYWWVAVLGGVVLLSYELGLNRAWYWTASGAIIFGAVALWSLLSLSGTVIRVEKAVDGERWLYAGPAKLPASAVDRTLAVPATAKSAAMGRQLDPEAYIISHSWVPGMVMLVLDDPQDPTPYWLISSKDPDALLKALGRPIY